MCTIYWIKPRGSEIYLVGALDRKEEMHIIKIIAIDQGWAMAVHTGFVNTMGREFQREANI